MTLIELLIVVAIIGILASIAIPSMRTYTKKAHYAAALAECKPVYHAFMVYHLDHNTFPDPSNAPAFELDTFAPLEYGGNLAARMQGGKADKYESPGDNQEFYLRMTLNADPSVQYLIARSDNVDIEPGVWLEGVYVYRNGIRLTP